MALDGLDRDILDVLQNTISGDIEPRIKKYIEKDPQIPIWEPSSGDLAITAHIASLKIPSLQGHSGNSYPSLLLHNLGKLVDQDLDGRISHLLEGDWRLLYVLLFRKLND
jgi:hypothetical protein